MSEYRHSGPFAQVRWPPSSIHNYQLNSRLHFRINEPSCSCSDEIGLVRWRARLRRRSVTQPYCSRPLCDVTSSIPLSAHIYTVFVARAFLFLALFSLSHPTIPPQQGENQCTLSTTWFSAIRVYFSTGVLRECHYHDDLVYPVSIHMTRSMQRIAVFSFTACKPIHQHGRWSSLLAFGETRSRACVTCPIQIIRTPVYALPKRGARSESGTSSSLWVGGYPVHGVPESATHAKFSPFCVF